MEGGCAKLPTRYTSSNAYNLIVGFVFIKLLTGKKFRGDF